MPAEPGQMLSQYGLVEKIGEGGMGMVWKAEPDFKSWNDVPTWGPPESEL